MKSRGYPHGVDDATFSTSTRPRRGLRNNALVACSAGTKKTLLFLTKTGPLPSPPSPPYAPPFAIVFPVKSKSDGHPVQTDPTITSVERAAQSQGSYQLAVRAVKTLKRGRGSV